MIKLQDFADIDFAAAVAGLSWALLAAQGFEPLAHLTAPEVAFAAAGVAFTRWANRIRKRLGEP